MANNTTEHNQKRLAKTAAAARKKVLADGGILISVLIRKENGTDLFRTLAEHGGSKSSAVPFLLAFYAEHKKGQTM